MKFPKKPKCYKCGEEVRFFSVRKGRRVAIVTFKCRKCELEMRRRVYA